MNKFILLLSLLITPFLLICNANSQEADDLDDELIIEVDEPVKVEENLNSLSDENGLAIFFVRSFDWCPYCQTQAKEVNSRAADFKGRGVTPIMISYDTPETQKTFYDRWNFSVPLLSDTGSNVIKAFGILNDNGISQSSPMYGIPHPVVFIVAPDGTIRDKLYIESDTVVNGANYKERPPVDDILAAIDNLD